MINLIDIWFKWKYGASLAKSKMEASERRYMQRMHTLRMEHARQIEERNAQLVEIQGKINALEATATELHARVEKAQKAFKTIHDSLFGEV